MTQIKGYPPSWVEAALEDALAQRSAGRPAVLAISGLQGSGKSTFAGQIAQRARSRQLQAEVLSIDDVYLTRAERTQLGREVHPLLATRGPPGTHDLALAAATLDALDAGTPVRLPRFDKLADDRLPESHCPSVQRPLDLLVLEGWFLGTPAEDAAALAVPLNRLERERDRTGTWRRYCNDALGERYPALWRRFDRLWLLQAPDFDIIPTWRLQQEQALQAAQPGRPGMSAAQIGSFVQFYERVSRQALCTLPGIADRCIRLDRARTPSLP